MFNMEGGVDFDVQYAFFMVRQDLTRTYLTVKYVLALIECLAAHLCCILLWAKSFLHWLGNGRSILSKASFAI